MAKARPQIGALSQPRPGQGTCGHTRSWSGASRRERSSAVNAAFTVPLPSMVADKIRKPHITIGAVKFAGAVAEYDAALIEAAFFPASTVDISDGNAKTGNESMAPRDFICAQARMVHIAAPQAAESTDCKILLYALAARPAGRPQRHRHTGRDNGLAGWENNFKHSAAASFQKMGERDARSPIPSVRSGICFYRAVTAAGQQVKLLSI